MDKYFIVYPFPKNIKAFIVYFNLKELYGDNVNKHKALLVWNSVKF